ncbi:hypothetical protein OTU49_004696 [Cherax quadricarinatus]|uniref:Uncharacterized protein n=1 Tax=Cherax quadricarinatus TaxID=27406 RepID=A0AAW0WXN3_CHEQU
MVNASKVIHALVVLAVVGAYTIVLMRGLNTHFTDQVTSSLQMEMDKNPHMRDDYEAFKAQLREEEKQHRQIKELEEKAKRFQERLSKRAEENEPLKYIQLEGLEQVNLKDAQELGNFTRRSEGRREEL